jgi:hypothetical protein
MKKQKKSNKKSRFGANVVADVNHQNTSKSYGYLRLPSGVKVFKEQAGKARTELDIIPYIVGTSKHPDANPDVPDSAHKGNPWYKLPILVHHGIGVGNNKQSLICPKTLNPNAKCFICEQKDQQFADGVEAKDVVGKISPRNLYLVIPKGMKDYEEEIHIWDIAQGNFQAFLNKELAEKPEKASFPDPETGKTLSIRFSEESYAGNKYAECSRIDFEKRDHKYTDKIMEEAPCLEDCIKILSNKELKNKFLAIEVDDDDDDDDDNTKGFEEESKPRKKKKLSKSKSFKEEKTKDKKKDKKKGKSKCPFGHKFGKDWDDTPDCDDCKKLDACGEASEA